MALEVTIELLREEQATLACGERRLASRRAFKWSQARPLGGLRYACRLERGGHGVRELGLGLWQELSGHGQLLTNLVKVALAPIEVARVSPARGPTTGGTAVHLVGRGFLALAAFGDGLLCQFGAEVSRSSEAVPHNDTHLTC
jgi:hypothetical protein